MELVNLIYSKGAKSFSYPFRITCLENASKDRPAKIIISVPKRNHKKAVNRNFIRRRIKEAIRLNIKNYPQLENKHIMFVYVSSEKYSYEKIYGYIQSALEQISN